MKHRTKSIFPVFFIVLVLTLLFPTRVFAQDQSTPTLLPTDIPAVLTDPAPLPTLDPTNTPTADAPSEMIATSAALPEADSASSSLYQFVYFMVGTHTNNYDDIQTAINQIIANPTMLFPTDGKIYLREGSQNLDVVLDGSTNSILSNLLGIVGTGSSLATINGKVEITGTNSGFTLSGVTISSNTADPAVNIHDNKGTLTLTDLGISNPTGDALIVSNQSGAVIVSNVSASDSGGKGAGISNNVPAAAYPVTVKNSEFDDNVAAALSINSRGAVTLDGVSASRSQSGLTISNASAITIKNNFFGNAKTGTGVTLSPASMAAVTMDTVFANGNAGSGVIINSRGGAVTLNYLSASSNGSDGLTISTLLDPAGAVKFSYSEVNNNGLTAGNGLSVFSKSAITLTQVNASGNKGAGISLDNCLYNGTKCAATASVTVTGTSGNNYSANSSGAGIYVRSNGAVSISDFTSSGNSGAGVDIINAFNGSIGNVSLLSKLSGWTNSIVGNGLIGINIQSNGTISLDKFNSSNNTGSGAVLDNSGATTTKLVDIKNSLFDANVTGGGLTVTSKGSIALTNVGASNNQTYGASLYNANGSGPVSILPGLAGLYTNFGGNQQWGVFITSRGSVTVKNIRADSNGFSGLYIDNQFTPAMSATVSNGTFSQNHTAGLEVYSYGVVNISNVVANGNLASYGGKIGNDISNLPSQVSVTNGTFDSNGSGGLNILARGSVTLNTINANDNGTIGSAASTGLTVDNCLFSGGVCLGNASITLGGGRNSFDQNGAQGVAFYSKGAISLSNFSANDNGMQGVFLRNDYSGSTAGITVNAPAGILNETNSNGFWDPTYTLTYSGLWASSFGNITFKQLNSFGNSGSGLTLDDHLATATRIITLQDVTSSFNQYQGININARGTASLTNLLSEANSFTTASISLAANSGQGQTISDRLTSSSIVDRYYFQGAGLNAITIIASSSDFLPHLELFDSSNPGTVLANGSTQINFTLPADGLYYIAVSSMDNYGDYILSLIPSSGTAPASDPIYANGIQAVATGAVNLLNVAGNNNARDGVVVIAAGAIKGNNVSATDNGEFGVNISNQVSLISSLTLTGGTASANDREGYNLWSWGAINLSGLTSKGSMSGNGIFAANYNVSIPQPVTISNATVQDNLSLRGLYVISRGNITVNGVIAANNNIGVKLIVNAPPTGYAAGKITIQALTGVNTINNNATAGLWLDTPGAISISKVVARGNNGDGIHILNANALSVANSSLLFNLQDGLNAAIGGPVAMTNLTSVGNGTSLFPGNGVTLALTNNPVAFTGGVFLGNHGAGVKVNGGSLYTLINTFYMGNNVDNTPGILNFMWNLP